MTKFLGLSACSNIAVLSVALSIAPLAASRAAELAEPPVFSSSHGVLDLVFIAKPQPITSLDFVKPGGGIIRPTGWIYEICYRTAGRQDCPASPQTVASLAASGWRCSPAIR